MTPYTIRLKILLGYCERENIKGGKLTSILGTYTLCSESTNTVQNTVFP